MLSDLANPDAVPGPTRRPQSAHPVILIDTDPSADLLTDAHGVPVWPIRNEAELAALSRLCERRSIGIQNTRGSAAGCRQAWGTQRWGTVCAIGPSCVHAVARLYAHLTGRRFRTADAAAPNDPAADRIVVTTFDHVSSELLHRLYSDPDASTAPGLICASTIAQLRRQVLARAVYAHHPQIAHSAPWRAVYPTEQVGSHQRDTVHILGGASAPDDIRDAFAARSGVLTLSTHSDGIDAMLGQALALCGVDASDCDQPGARMPSCLVNGFCHRFGVTVSDVPRMERTISPASIAADVFVFDTCFGILAADAPIDAQFGLGRHLAENPAIGAMLTTWELTVLDPDKLQGLYADLRAGIDLGRAVARFNGSDAARRNATRLALFGDPRTSFCKLAPMPTQGTTNARPLAPRGAAASPAPAKANELAFSRAYLEHGITDLMAQRKASNAPFSQRLTRQLATAERALNLLRSVEQTHAENAHPEDLRGALIDDAFVRRPLDDWKIFAEKSMWTQCRCAVCSAASWVAILRPQVAGVSCRRVVLCPCCGVSEDMPEHVRLNLHFDRATGICSLRGDAPQQDWSAALFVRTRLEAHDRLWDWPAEPGGKPSQQMQMPEDLPAGPVRLAVVMVHGGWIAWTAQDCHGGPAHAANSSP